MAIQKCSYRPYNQSSCCRIAFRSSNVGNQFAPVVSAIILDTNGNKTYDPGVDQPLISGANTAALAAGASLDAFVVVTLPQGVTDGQTAQVRLVAEAATGSGTPGTILPGKGQGGGDAVVGATTAISNLLGSLIASSISLAITKTATVVDPYGHSAVIPGSIITFQLKAVFTGSASASNAHIADVIPGWDYLSGWVSQARRSKPDRYCRRRRRRRIAIGGRCQSRQSRGWDNQNGQVRRQSQLIRGAVSARFHSRLLLGLTR